MTIEFDELVAKEACYHASCFDLLNVDNLSKLVVVKSSGWKRIDIGVWCVLRNSVENAEWRNQCTGKVQSKNIVDSSQIKQWGAFLSSGNSKAELIQFLASRWESQSFIIGDGKFYVVFDEQCICIKVDGSSELIGGLECNQEEADTRMLLQAQHICHSTENFIIYAPDTDVFIITIVISTDIPGTCLFALAVKVLPASYL